MRALLLAGLIGAAGAVAVSTPSVAARPEPSDFTLVTRSCGFPVQVDQAGKVKVIMHGDKMITVAPGARVTLTNPASGASVSLNVSGTFHEQVLPNGDLVGKATGHNTFAGPGVGTILYTTGPVSYVQNGTTGVVTITSPSRNTVDICTQLA